MFCKNSYKLPAEFLGFKELKSRHLCLKPTAPKVGGTSLGNAPYSSPTALCLVEEKYTVRAAEHLTN